jgi:hypothetical protein
MGLEGIVSKRLDAPYRSGPSKTWVKSKNPASEAVRREREEEWRLDPPMVIRCMNSAASTWMRLDQTLGQSRHVACASGCISMRTSLEEGIKVHRFAGMFPEQFFTEAGRHREAVVAADQRMVIRCFRDDLAGFVHDVSHVPPPIQRAGLVDAPFWRHHEGRNRQLDAAEHLKGTAYHEGGHAVVAYLSVERTYSLSRPPSVPLRQR